MKEIRLKFYWTARYKKGGKCIGILYQVFKNTFKQKFPIPGRLTLIVCQTF